MMLRGCAGLALAMGLASCGSRAVDRDLGGVEPPATRSYNVVDLDIVVPRTLTVSERTLYYPGSDIVWRGEPPGDRHAQVQRIFEEGMGSGTAALDGSRDVAVEIEVARFHSLTERARYSTGGVHSIRYTMTVRDAATGQVIEGPRWISADLEAFGGQRAIDADLAGQTQRVRIVDHLDGEIVRQLDDAGEAGGQG